MSDAEVYSRAFQQLRDKLALDWSDAQKTVERKVEAVRKYDELSQPEQIEVFADIAATGLLEEPSHSQKIRDPNAYMQGRPSRTGKQITNHLADRMGRPEFTNRQRRKRIAHFIQFPDKLTPLYLQMAAHSCLGPAVTTAGKLVIGATAKELLSDSPIWLELKKQDRGPDAVWKSIVLPCLMEQYPDKFSRRQALETPDSPNSATDASSSKVVPDPLAERYSQNMILYVQCTTIDAGKQKEKYLFSLKTLADANTAVSDSSAERSPQAVSALEQSIIADAHDQVDAHIASLEIMAKLCAHVEVPPGGARTYAVDDVCGMARVSDQTLNKYAKIAGVATPGRGKHNHRYTEDEVKQILQAIKEQGGTTKMKENAREALNRLLQSRGNPT
jgi:hypothetical protein